MRKGEIKAGERIKLKGERFKVKAKGSRFKDSKAKRQKVKRGSIIGNLECGRRKKM